MLSVEDRLMIGETLSMHGHLFDEGELDRLGEIFTSDVVYDISDIGYGVLVGIDAVRDAAIQLGEANPLAHIVTTETAEDGVATVRSKGIAITRDHAGTATYLDTVRRDDKRWRISHRRILARREPLVGRVPASPEL